MPGTRPNPTASRRALAARLRRMRLTAGKSTDDAARELLVSPSKISRLESGDRMPQPRDVRDLARYYGASEQEVGQLQELVLEARRKGWWEEFSTHDEQSETYYGLETAATRIDMFENLRWPGLLQTPEMTRALLGNLRPEGELGELFIEDQVTLRRKRQERLLSGEMSFHVVVDEAMFHRPMGDGVVERQVRRMIELSSDLTSLKLQVVPFSKGCYPGLDGSFHILSAFEPTDLGPTVLVEGLLGVRLIEHPKAVEHYRVVFNSIAVKNALPPVESTAWLKAFLRALAGG